MNCLYTGMQWNKRSPQVVLEAILVQRILLFEQFVSASKLAPEILKERRKGIAFEDFACGLISPVPPPPPIRLFNIVMIPLPHRWQVNHDVTFLHSLPLPLPLFTLCWTLLILPLFYLKTVWPLQNLPPPEGTDNDWIIIRTICYGSGQWINFLFKDHF